MIEFLVMISAALVLMAVSLGYRMNRSNSDLIHAQRPQPAYVPVRERRTTSRRIHAQR